MEYSFEHLSTISPKKKSLPAIPFNSSNYKELNVKQKKKKMEEIHQFEKKAVQYMELIASCQIRFLDKALENLSYENDVLRLNLIETTLNMEQHDIENYHNYLCKTLLKLNSIVREVKKINQHRLRKSVKRIHLHRDTKISLNHTENLQQLSLTKSKTFDEKKFNQIKLLYKKQMADQLKRRDQQQWIQGIQARVKNNLKNNEARKQAQRKKKLQMREKSQKVTIQSKQNNKAQVHEIMNKKILKLSCTSEPKMALTKINDYSQKVATNKQRISRQLQKKLESLQFGLKQKISSNRFYQTTIKNHPQKSLLQNQVMKRKEENDKVKQSYFLTALIQKNAYIESLGTTCSIKNTKQQNSSLKNKLSTLESDSKSFKFKLLDQQIYPQPRKILSQNVSKRSYFLKDSIENFQKRNNFYRERFQKNRIERRTQEQQRIENLNSTYYESLQKIQHMKQNLNRRRDNHIHLSFQLRKQQDNLQNKLNKILQKPKGELKKKLQNLDSQKYGLFLQNKK